MSMVAMKLLSAAKVEKLAAEIADNIDRYVSGDFTDLSKETGWSIETTLASWNPAIVRDLDPSGTAEAEVRNSLLLYKGLAGMTPALAREERLWVRLCHVECLEYARVRWLGQKDAIAKAARLHFFASGLRGCRDQNAIGRLWWNGHVASLATPDNIEIGLKALLARANIRLQVIDRADSAFREPLIGCIVRLLGKDPWFNSNDAAIADFMFEVNKRSGGMIFEALNNDALDGHLEVCLEYAKSRHSA